jgi:hypothetical protein
MCTAYIPSRTSFQNLIVVLVVIITPVVLGGDILLYADVEHKGTPARLSVNLAHTHCVNFDSELKNKVSSINTKGQCVLLWYSNGCTGAYARIAPGTSSHWDFNKSKFDDKDSNLNDNTESISGCIGHSRLSGKDNLLKIYQKTSVGQSNSHGIRQVWLQTLNRRSTVTNGLSLF